MDSKNTPVIISIYNGTGSAFCVDLSSFGKNKVTFGSAADNDICIDSAVVSEHHGCFQLTGMGWVALDINSQNGIVVDGVRRKDARLTKGMEINIFDADDETKAAATIIVGADDQIAAPLADDDTAEAESDVSAEPVKPKKKSKAPLIIAIILVAVFILGFIGVAILGISGLGGVALISHIMKKKADTSVNVDATVEYTDVPVADVSDIFIDVPETTEPEVEVVLPERVPSSNYCEQYILAKCEGSYTTLTLYEMEDGVWVEKMTADGRVGKNGITDYKREGDGCTPAGEFDLTFCCGVSDPHSGLTFRPINQNSVWVDDVNSAYYNTLQSSTKYDKDWDSAEPMMSSYFSNNRHNYCINIAANGDGYTSDTAYPGNGSVITLCGKNDTLIETHGCMDISGDDMLELLSYLDSNKYPVIIIYE